MAAELNSRQIRKNILISVFAQCVSLIVSLIMNLIVPKFIDVSQYAYWQMYLLYISYVGVLHFGLLDGLILRYAKYDYDELNKPLLRSQFIGLLTISVLCAFFGILIAILFGNGEIKWIVMFVSLGIVTRNVFNYTSYILQMTNRIDKYASMIIAYRLFFGVAISSLLMIGVYDFHYFCILDLSSDLFGIIVGSKYNKGLYFGKTVKTVVAFRELKNNLSSGLMLMLANWSSFLLTGSARLIIQWNWNEITFGFVSFSFSVINLFLTFVSAISAVLFPSLKRIQKKEFSILFQRIKNGINPLLICILILYYPGCWILNKWIPDYAISLKYLGILLPIIISSSKIGLLTNNYMKALRKEKMLFGINIISIIIAIGMFVLSAYYFDDLKILLICIVLIMEMKSIALEWVIMFLLKINEYKESIIEIIMISIFIFSATKFKLAMGGIVYFIAITFYILFYRKQIVKCSYNIIHIVKNKLKNE